MSLCRLMGEFASALVVALGLSKSACLTLRG